MSGPGETYPPARTSKLGKSTNSPFLIHFWVIELMRRPGYLLLLILFAWSPVADAQIIISGYARDATTDQFLSGATVQVEDGFQATVTNGDGRFEINVVEVPVTLRISQVGYFSQQLIVEKQTPVAQQVMLIPAEFDLDPVIVTDRESVEDIMRRVIERKKAWYPRLKSLRCEASARMTVERDTGIMFMMEGLADAAWSPEKGWNIVMKSFRRSSGKFFDDDINDLETLDELGEEALVLNLYDDDIALLAFKMMGVTHPDALNTYRFEMLGQRLMDNRIVYDIGVRPKSKLATAFVGRISVIDKDFALISAELTPNESMIFPPPVRDFSMHIKQQWARFGDGFWLPIGLQTESALETGIIGLVFPDMIFKLKSQWSNYQVFGASAAAPKDSVYIPPPLEARADRVILAYDDQLVAGKMVPLSDIEKEAYGAIDSTKSFIQAFEPKGFIARVMKRQGAFDEDDDDDQPKPSMSGRRGYRGERRSKRLGFEYGPTFRYNRVDAAHLGLSSRLRIYNTPLTLNALGAYNTGTKNWSYGGGMSLRWGDRNQRYLSTQYLKDTETRYPSLYSKQVVSSVPLFGGEDYFDYYRNERLRARLGSRLGRSRWNLVGGVNIERHRSMSKTTDYTLFGINHIQRSNPGINPGRLRSLTIRTHAGRAPKPYNAEGYRYFNAEAEFSHPDLLGSDFSFSTYRLTYSHRIPTLFKRRMFPNTLDLRLVGGFSQGTLPLQRFGTLDGTLGLSSTMGVFRTLRQRPYEGEHYAGVFWDHNFRTIPVEILGIKSLVKHGIGLSVYGGHGRTWISSNRQASLPFTPSYQNKFHHELGFSITGLAYFFRLDFTKRIDASGFFIGLGIGPGFVL